MSKPVESPYVSSITTKYGAPERVRSDAGTLRGILDRQGNSLLIDAIAEYAGWTANTFNLSAAERATLVAKLVREFEESLKERL